MKLYYSKGACSLAVRIIIHELNLPCEFESVNLKSKKTASGADYFEVNPKGSVATLVLENGEILTENVVIMQYLADTHNATHLLPSGKDMKRYRTLEWMNFVTTEIHKSFGPLFSAAVSDDMKNDYSVPLLEKKFQFIEDHLKNHAYLMGEEFTLPDGYLFVMLRWMTPIAKISFDDLPNLKKYFELLKQRPTILKSLEEEGLN
jgi:glutathione S-transferase